MVIFYDGLYVCIYLHNITVNNEYQYVVRCANHTSFTYHPNLGINSYFYSYRSHCSNSIQYKRFKYLYVYTFQFTYNSFYFNYLVRQDARMPGVYISEAGVLTIKSAIFIYLYLVIERWFNSLRFFKVIYPSFINQDSHGS